MKKSIILSSIVASALVATSLLASTNFLPNLNEELSYNKEMLKKYRASIEKLEKRNAYLEKLKKEHPKLYVKKALYEDLKDKYIYRIKLDGAEAKNMSVQVKNHIMSVSMNLKVERNDESGYYMSAREFYQQFTIPKDVEESKISNSVDGDYFEIIMPKKKS